ncbi:MAG: PspC domain-containing protein [Gemmatimonadetes bacterium]|nr:PspC domain-containing protein [Gemmatimonadota bacterium]
MNERKRLLRPRQGKWIAGVCAGLANYFSVDPTAVRAAYVVLSIVSAAFPGILLYIVLWIIIPREPEPAAQS